MFKGDGNYTSNVIVRNGYKPGGMMWFYLRGTKDGSPLVILSGGFDEDTEGPNDIPTLNQMADTYEQINRLQAQSESLAVKNLRNKTLNSITDSTVLFSNMMQQEENAKLLATLDQCKAILTGNGFGVPDCF